MPGDRVGYVWSADAVTPAAGVVRYVGPVKGLGEDGHWFGVELLEVPRSEEQSESSEVRLAWPLVPPWEDLRAVSSELLDSPSDKHFIVGK